ncbi:hypothetical protein Sps_01032 [Shewanella psychrophila]|uniref:Uncharacterized protein n=1 Tax=Shewanella psychrophila TaxID=225848 RepID=A0A1S6HL12_9GAMM|nr:hypothetical protein [Shewanella psychrophila]AQS36221.1 hypothetical protein Sps_01032 [Shewanella psychrophila]
MTSEEDIKTLEQQVYQAPILFEWEYIGSDIKGWLRLLLAIGGPGALFGSIVLFGARSTIGAYVGLSVMTLLFIFMVRYLFIPDSHYHYKLTKLGIHYTQEDLIPEMAYTLARGFARVGIVVCLIALFVIGPLAFVGAGAFALMAFGMTNFKSKIDQNIILFSDANILFSLNNDVLINIEPMDEIEFNFVGTIYATSLAKKESIIAELVPLLGEVEVVNIKRRNDIYKHPVFTSNQSEQ